MQSNDAKEAMGTVSLSTKIQMAVFGCLKVLLYGRELSRSVWL